MHYSHSSVVRFHANRHEKNVLAATQHPAQRERQPLLSQQANAATPQLHLHIRRQLHVDVAVKAQAVAFACVVATGHNLVGGMTDGRKRRTSADDASAKQTREPAAPRPLLPCCPALNTLQNERDSWYQSLQAGGERFQGARRLRGEGGG